MNNSAVDSQLRPDAKQDAPGEISLGGISWQVWAGALDSELRDFIEAPDDFFPALEPGTARGQGATSVSRRGRFFFKRYNHSRDRFSKIIKNIFRVPPAINAFEMGLRLTDLGVFTPRPLVVGQKRVAGVLLRAYLVTEWLEAAKSPLDHSEPLRCAVEIAEPVATLHKHGLLHRDLNLTNVLYARDGPLNILDLDTARDVGCVSKELACAELARFLRNALRAAPVPLPCRLAFLKRYCQLRAIDDWKSFWKKIETLHQSELQRLARKTRN